MHFRQCQSQTRELPKSRWTAPMQPVGQMPSVMLGNRVAKDRQIKIASRKCLCCFSNRKSRNNRVTACLHTSSFVFSHQCKLLVDKEGRDVIMSLPLQCQSCIKSLPGAVLPAMVPEF